MTHGNAKNQNAKKPNPLTRTISVKVSQELAQCLTERAVDGNHNLQARRELMALFNL